MYLFVNNKKSISSFRHALYVFVGLWICFVLPEQSSAQPIPIPDSSRAQIGSKQRLESTKFNPKLPFYVWPTEASDYMSATFGETRAAHFHAAIDIKTWGRRGYKVFATREGVVHRLSIAAYGYGKVVYIKHPDNSYSLYAHLDGFREDIADSVDSWRLKQALFEIDTTFTEPLWEVKQGELLGYTGSTGIGPPHLHFELRTPTESPFNPLLTNITVPDKVSPRISRILLEPLSPGSSIQGQKEVFIKQAAYNRGYTFGRIKTRGSVGIAVDAFDQASEVANVYAVYGFRALANGDTLFSAKVDSFSYNETGQMFIDRVYREKLRTGAGFQRLWMRDGNTLPFYDRKYRGLVFTTPGTYDIVIEAFDFFGNKTEARLELIVSDAAFDSLTVVHGETTPSQGFESIQGIWENDWFVNASVDKISILGAWEKPDKDSYNFSDFASFSIQKNESTISFYRIQPAHPATIFSWDQKTFVRFPSSTFYDTLSISFQTKWSGDTLYASIFPDSEPVDKNFHLEALLDEALPHKTKYRWYHRNVRRKSWTLRKSYVEGNKLVGSVNDLGLYSAFPDTVAPEIWNPRIFRTSRGELRFAIDADDYLSGIDYSNIRVYCDGVLGISEYEPDRNRIVYRHPDFSVGKIMEFRVEIFDRAGNLAVFEGAVRP